ncbi:MAG: carbonate dehydratase [Xanthomonadaceae bacterium]|jgi:carbonic anhydrase|nr:carbonate dehydratase [Xanthomonadaceae bacterium]
MSQLEKLLQKNADWAERVVREDPQFFGRLADQQAPEYLWIGCSDSRVPANQIIDMAPGEVFVHRNVANVVVHTDLNCLSAIQFAVDVLKVRHILVVGHYGCSGVKATLEEQRVGLADNWLRHVGDVATRHFTRLAQVADHRQKHDLLCTLNVLEQTANVCESTVVQDAWARRQPLTIHGWIYSLKNGLVTDLSIDVSARGELEQAYRLALQRVDESLLAQQDGDSQG